MKNQYFFYIKLVIFLLTSCKVDKSKPSRVYMPDMYYSDAYEAYSDPNPNYKQKIDSKKIKIIPFEKGKSSSLLPVYGTVSRNDYGFFPSDKSDNNNEGYNFSKKKRKSPLKNENENELNRIIEDGKNIYNINCSICHGENGDGQGLLVKNEKILGIPNYKERDITVGSVYHTITYGKNNMNSYSSQINEIDRWKVAEYVMFLKNKK
ncbi:c-type cytochrome [Blattabacterium cuenoti]|uniref:c-type cytochrome n=1 Tax=Blattabacterium cuenoti TaxID=1653831 RepID=UPI00163BF749|nr:cytochrome c [Blattabacterium cuenoti]